MNTSTNLPVVSCEGCGACCFHMGYPAFVLPRAPMTESEIAADPQLSARAAKDARFKQDLLTGNEGESYWHALPEDLRTQWQAYVDQYELPSYDGTVESLDGPCIWLDMETRQCKNHLHRPNICRDFATGSPGCLQWRKHYEGELV